MSTTIPFFDDFVDCKEMQLPHCTNTSLSDPDFISTILPIPSSPLSYSPLLFSTPSTPSTPSSSSSLPLTPLLATSYLCPSMSPQPMAAVISDPDPHSDWKSDPDPDPDSDPHSDSAYGKIPTAPSFLQWNPSPYQPRCAPPPLTILASVRTSCFYEQWAARQTAKIPQQKAFLSRTLTWHQSKVNTSLVAHIAAANLHGYNRLGLYSKCLARKTSSLDTVFVNLNTKFELCVHDPPLHPLHPLIDIRTGFQSDPQSRHPFHQFDTRLKQMLPLIQPWIQVLNKQPSIGYFPELDSPIPAGWGIFVPLHQLKWIGASQAHYHTLIDTRRGQPPIPFYETTVLENQLVFVQVRICRQTQTGCTFYGMLGLGNFAHRKGFAHLFMSMQRADDVGFEVEWTCQWTNTLQTRFLSVPIAWLRVIRQLSLPEE